MRGPLPLAAFAAALFLTACDDGPPANEATIAPGETAFFDLLETPVGDVNFASSCNAEAAPLVERGVALLHHMMYQYANLVFVMAAEADEACGLAYWGQTMTMIHPLWPDVPTGADIATGTRLVEKSIEIGAGSAREKAYLETTKAYFVGGETLSERERLARFDAAWQAVAEGNPADLEAQAFYALAHRAAADPTDTKFTQQQRAGAMAESVLAKSPNHPGAHHYIIHSYDYPGLAEKALPIADSYGKLTPRVPHAAHMMTHIYTRLGLWEQAIEWNEIAAESAWEICLSTGEINVHYTHSLDYLAYAHLQRGNDGAVVDILNNAAELKPPYSRINPNATAYAFAALPARYALERRDWGTAIRLQPRMPATFPWKPVYDPYVAMTPFARALAFARLGRPNEAEGDIQTLRAFHDRINPTSAYWGGQIKIQETSARAWQAFARNETDAALALMKTATQMEAATQKDAVSPGEILPASELYGDMLMLAGNFAEALAAYRSTLERSPQRFNALYGAGKAAAATGDIASATAFFQQLVAVTGGAKVRSSLDDVHAYLKANAPTTSR